MEMTHYLHTKDKTLKVKIEMGCNHPKMRENNAESIGCKGNCEECKFSIATLTVPEMFALLERAECIYK